METVAALKLPRLPATGWTDLQFQAWWQDVVTRIEDAVNAINVNAGESGASDAQLAAIEASLAALRSDLRQLDSAMQLQFATLEAANTDKLRRDMETLEIAAWLL
jgi:hypothetical protein